MVKPARHRRISAQGGGAAAVGAAGAGRRWRGLHQARRAQFTEDFGFAPMVSQDGAERLVTSGSLAHIELLNGRSSTCGRPYDGAELRIVYSLTDRSGELHLAATVANGYEMPGYDAGETQICDYVLVNGQNVDFDQAWEVPGDAPGRCSIICKPTYRRGARRWRMRRRWISACRCCKTANRWRSPSRRLFRRA